MKKMNKATITCNDCDILPILSFCPECGLGLNYFNRWVAFCRNHKNKKKHFYRVNEITIECLCGNSNLYFKKNNKI